MRSRFRLALAGVAAAAAVVAIGAGPDLLTPRAESGRQYVQFEPLIVPIYIGGEPAGLVGARVAIAVADRDRRDAIEAARPRLTDAFVGALGAHANLYLDPERPIDLAALSAALTEAARRAGAGEGEVLLMETLAYAP